MWTSFPNEFNDCPQLTESETLEIAGVCRNSCRVLPGIAGLGQTSDEAGVLDPEEKHK